MNDHYDAKIARHYAAYRPDLHCQILDHLIHPYEFFKTGLDVGCGTGYSAIALAKYCDRVVGIDASKSMLDAAQSHPRVTYFNQAADELSHLEEEAFQVVTFAGSLFYTKTVSLHKGLVQKCPPGSVILVYDFEVLLNEFIEALGIDCPSGISDYDHRTNLSDWVGFAVEQSGSKRLRLNVSEHQIAHLLLSDSSRYQAVLSRFPNGDPFSSILHHLVRLPGERQLNADIYFNRYRVFGA